MSAGIYCIKNDVNKKVYVGKAKNLENRWEQHKTKLLNNNHDNIFLQQDFNDYGLDSFTYSVLEKVPEQPNINKILFAKEREWGEKLNARDRNYGYNIANFQQIKENNYNEAKSLCFLNTCCASNNLQYIFTYIAYNLPVECCIIYLHLSERAMSFGTSGVEKEDDGMAIIKLKELALLINNTEIKTKKLIMLMKKHDLLKPYINRKDDTEYGFKFYESLLYSDEVNKKWENI